MSKPVPMSGQIIVDAEQAGARLDVVLSQAQPRVSRRQWRTLLLAGCISIDGLPARKGDRLRPGARVSWRIPVHGAKAAAIAEQQIVLQHARVLLLNKPAGQACHPQRPGEQGSLIQQVALRFPEVERAGPQPLEGGLVHRLDTDTSGLVAVARDSGAHAELRRCFAEGRANKTYLAVVWDNGSLPDEVEIDWPLGRHRSDSGRMVVLRSPQQRYRGNRLSARTQVRRLGAKDGLALVQVRIWTGRMHQIRVHLAELGHPLVGDSLYGQRSDRIARHALHAWQLSFVLHGEPLSARVPPPDDLAKIAKTCCPDLGS